MTSSVLFNSYLSQTNKYLQGLALIHTHPAFKSKVNEYYQILNLNPTSENLIQLGTLFGALFLPAYPHKHLKLLAQSILDNIRTHQHKVTYNNLTEYLLKLCSFAVENIDVKSAIGFLELLKSRITDTYLVSAADPSQRTKVSTEYRLDIIEAESMLSDTDLLEKHHREEMKHVYFEEVVNLSEEDLLKTTEK